MSTDVEQGYKGGGELIKLTVPIFRSLPFFIPCLWTRAIHLNRSSITRDKVRPLDDDGTSSQARLVDVSR